MWCNQIFSLIDEEIIQNIIVCDNYHVANQIAKASYGNDAYAVDTTHYPLAIGHTHVDGRFFDEEGNEISRNLTGDEEANLALRKVNELANKKVETDIEIDYRFSKIELGL